MVVERRCSRGRNESYVACDSQCHDDVLALPLMKGFFKTVSAALEASPCGALASVIAEMDHVKSVLTHKPIVVLVRSEGW